MCIWFHDDLVNLCTMPLNSNTKKMNENIVALQIISCSVTDGWGSDVW